MTKKKSDTSDTHLQQALTALNRYIETNGLRHTQEREEVLTAILSIRGRFTIEDLSDIENLNVSRGTLVNTVNTLVEAGILLKAGMKGRHVLYQATPKTNKRQSVYRTPFVISLQCNNCGKTKEIRDNVALAPLASRRFRGFNTFGGVVTIYGLCTECAERPENIETRKK